MAQSAAHEDNCLAAQEDREIHHRPPAAARPAPPAIVWPFPRVTGFNGLPVGQIW